MHVFSFQCFQAYPTYYLGVHQGLTHRLSLRCSFLLKVGLTVKKTEKVFSKKGGI